MTFNLEAMANNVARLLPLLRDGEDLGAVMDARTLETLKRARTFLIGAGQVFQGIATSSTRRWRHR
jgi:hypothetical protein